MKTYYKNLKILVTGGAGFIGSHISEKLISLGAKVTVLDNLSTGSLKNIKNDVNFIHGDISDIDTCLSATKNQDLVFHLAAFISVPLSLQDPSLCHKINVNGTFNILNTSKINKVKRVIFSSSSAVYGNQEKTCTEEMPCNPESPYGFSKLMGELYCKQFFINFNLETVILRYFNVYGARQNPNGEYAAVSVKFKNLMQQNLPITIFGDGLQTRDFTPVEKVVEANLLLGSLSREKVTCKTFNVATGKSVHMIARIELLKKDFPYYNKKILFAPERSGDIKQSNAHSSKINALL